MLNMLEIFTVGQMDPTLVFIGRTVLFLSLFVFLPKLIQQARRRMRLR
jgi:hypothetical protein